MNRIPSPSSRQVSGAALVVALLALVASLGGTSYAAKLITGKDIKNSSVTGQDIKNGSLTGQDIKGRSIAGSDLKPGVTATKTFAKRFKATNGPSEDAARAAAPVKLILKKGSLSVYAKCFTDASGPVTYGEVYVKTSKDGALFDSDEDDAYGGDFEDFLNRNTPEEDRLLADESSSANDSDISGGPYSDWAAYGVDGSSILGFNTVAVKNGTLPGGNGAYGPGNVCVFTGGAY